MSVVYVVAGSAGASAYSTYKQGKAAEKGAKAQAKSSDRAADLQMEQYEQSRQDLMPWLGVGEGALYQLAGLQGIDMPYGPGQAAEYEELQSLEEQIAEMERDRSAAKAERLDYTDTPAGQPSFKNIRGRGLAGTVVEYAKRIQEKESSEKMEKELGELKARRDSLKSKIAPIKGMAPEDMAKRLEATPGYQFNLSQGLKATDLAMNKRGLLGSGRASKERQRYGAGLASQTYNDYLNRLAALSGVGQSTGGQIGQLGAGAAQSAGQATMAGGAARASGYQAKGQGYMNMANALSGGVGDYLGYNYLMNK
jgi:hypothetical protein